MPAEDLAAIADQHLHTAVHNPEQLAALETADLSEPVTVWMKLDTGMHRLGVRPESAEAFYQRLCQCKNVRQPVNMVSHFARADEPELRRNGTAAGYLHHLLRRQTGDALDRGFGRDPAVAAVALRLGALRASFFMAFRRWRTNPGGRILAFSRLCRWFQSLIAVREHKAESRWVTAAPGSASAIPVLAWWRWAMATVIPAPRHRRERRCWSMVREVKIVGRVAMDMICVDLGTAGPG